jgi:separase
MPFIDSIGERKGWDWSGVVGEFPTEEFVVKSITKKEGLFFYCGHGGGKGSFSKSKIESLVERSDSVMPCQAAIILMGCSSGKLASINRKEADPVHRTAMHYEPEGIALSYIVAGAPCVIGNLWDVTDRDIDRYCLTFMEQFLGGENVSLAHCIANARSSCKMKNIVGVAPVCYGLPVFVKSE